MDDRAAVKELLNNLRAQLPALEELLERCSGHWGYEDPVYRFYHQSWYQEWPEYQRIGCE